jgi:hypothetical protein
MALLLIIRYVLARENRLRDMEPPDETYNDVYVTKETADGRKIEVKVAKVRSMHWHSITDLIIDTTLHLGIFGSD